MNSSLPRLGAGFVPGGFSSIGGDMKKRLKKKLLAKRLANLSPMPEPVEDMRILNDFIHRFMSNMLEPNSEFQKNVSERPWDFV